MYFGRTISGQPGSLRYTEKGVYRESGHWGDEVASCSWYLKGYDYQDGGVELTERKTGFIRWEDLKAKGGVYNNEAHGFRFKTNLDEARERNKAKQADYIAAVERGDMETVNNANGQSVQRATRHDVQTLKTYAHLGKISINALTAEEIDNLSTIGEIMFGQLGEKSPIYRALYGEWRDSDETPVKVVNEIKESKGDFINEDTNWSINVGRRIYQENNNHGNRSSESARAYLPYIQGIVENAILLDTNISNKENQYSAFFHKMYAIADKGDGPRVLRLTVEELYDFYNDENKQIQRAYILNDIEEAFAVRSGLHSTYVHPPRPAKASKRTVADLYQYVKITDNDFTPIAQSQSSNRISNEHIASSENNNGTEHLNADGNQLSERFRTDLTGDEAWKNDDIMYAKRQVDGQISMFEGDTPLEQMAQNTENSSKYRLTKEDKEYSLI